MPDVSIVTKQEFAALVGVSPSCVSQWIARKKISGNALVGRGCRSRIRVDAARCQLQKNLDIDQRLGANGKARLDGQKTAAAAMATSDATDARPEASPDTLEEKIKTERLAQLALGNAKAREEEALRSGRYLETADAQQQMGRIAGRMVTMFDGTLADFANALAAAPPVSSRDILRVLRSTWRDIRVRQAKTLGAEASSLPPLLDEESDDPACQS